ncbi:MAG: DUF2811 domain-containing protein [Spirulina sp. SIO3F2]|nr:DUF2811 domain-containing protein [Spirulina sp. SIO3F2]
MATPISILTEIPEELHGSLRNYLDCHPTWDQDQVITAALSLFLLKSYSSQFPHEENGESQVCARVYLETLFQT